MGEPGAGKSTLLLELAHHLVKQAEQDPMRPLPVLLPLSSWANQRGSLQDWLIEQFGEQYKIPRNLSQQLVLAELVFATDNIEGEVRKRDVFLIHTLEDYKRCPSKGLRFYRGKAECLPV